MSFTDLVSSAANTAQNLFQNSASLARDLAVGEPVIRPKLLVVLSTAMSSRELARCLVTL